MRQADLGQRRAVHRSTPAPSGWFPGSFTVPSSTPPSRTSRTARRAITIAPTSAISNTSDASSNGNRYSRKNASPKRAVVGADTASVRGQVVTPTPVAIRKADQRRDRQRLGPAERLIRHLDVPDPVGEKDGEQQQDQDPTDVDQQLGHADEIRAQIQIEPSGTGERRQQQERRMKDVSRKRHTGGASKNQRRQAVEHEGSDPRHRPAFYTQIPPNSHRRVRGRGRTPADARPCDRKDDNEDAAAQG